MDIVQEKNNIRFIDLFAGLGGFHVGLRKLGHECVFAAEIDEDLRNLYAKNFNLSPAGDVRSIKEKSIPDHDMICAGFPCQPFSRAGKKLGAKCPSSGKLVDEIFRIAKKKAPNYIMLENVPDILTIEGGKFWNYLKGGLEGMGYEVDHKIYTPRDFGIPQKRNRVFIVACKNGLNHFDWPDPGKKTVKLRSVISNRGSKFRYLQKEKEGILNLWQKFITQTKEFTSLPILATEFGATYPYEKSVRTVKEMKEYRGAFGEPMKSCKNWKEVCEILPKYAREDKGKVSYRTAEAIKYSREIYKRHKEFIDGWKKNIVNLPLSWTKFEWQGYRNNPKIWEHIIQFRASGIRIIKPDCAPSLVAMSSTQIPILGPQKRYMSVKEAASLQSLECLTHFPETESGACKALGNAVNALIVNKIAEKLIH